MRNSSIANGGYYKNLVDNTSSIIVCFDKFGVIGFVNNYGCEFFGFKEYEVLGKKIGDLFFNSFDGGESCSPSIVQKIIGDGEKYKNFVCKSKRKNGEEVFIAWSNTVMQNAMGEISEVIALGSDITERKNLENRLEEMASIDSLTGIINRRKFNEMANIAMVKAKNNSSALSFFMIDIDDFKKVNDEFGHDKGDEALKFITSVCKKSLRKQDILARWGGEEFAVMLYDTPANEALKLAKRLIKNLNVSEMVINAQEKVGFGMSIGVSELTEKDGLEDVIKRADDNLYKAKRSGKNQAIL